MRSMAALLVPLVVMFTGLAAAAAEPVPGIAFHFAPPVGVHRESVRITRSLQIGDSDAQQAVSSIEREVTVQKTTEGYYFDVESLAGDEGDAGRGPGDPLTAWIEGALLRFDIDEKGQIREVRGYEEAVGQLQDEIGADRVAKLGMRRADPQRLAERAAELWQLRVGDFAGNSYEPGEILVTKQTMDLPVGDIATYHVAMRIGKAETCGKAQCARIELAYASDPAELADFVNASPAEARKILGGRDRSGADVTGGGSRLLELATLRLLEEELVPNRRVDDGDSRAGSAADPAGRAPGDLLELRLGGGVIPLANLPTLNAMLNGLATVFLVAGFGFIRTGRVAAHRACMLTATGISALFLVSYLYYHFHAGTTRFTGTGALRTAYLAILLTHSVLAAVVPFLVVITLWHALRGNLQRHRALARWTLPIWLYVSVTGVVVYWMLYRLF